MLTEFIEKQMKRARYKLIGDNTYFGEIPRIDGVWANAKTLEKCREQLQSVFEEWLVLQIKDGGSISGFSYAEEDATPSSRGNKKATTHA